MRALIGLIAAIALSRGGIAAGHAEPTARAACSVSYDGLVWYARARCGANGSFIPRQTTVFSHRDGGVGCRVSVDGLIWYDVPGGDFSPLRATQVRCAEPGRLTRLYATRVPTWAHAPRRTEAIFAIASLQEGYLADGMRALARVAHAAGLPVTWLVADERWLILERGRYDRYHRRFRDDLQTPPSLQLAARAALPWFRPKVAVEQQWSRDPEEAWRAGYDAFWGIAWNSHGIDGIADAGAPWGAYCADPAAFRRPALAGCPLVALEWTARDLTATYWSDREDIYSSDPDDLTLRGHYPVPTGERYMRALIDAYAAAAADRPVVIVAQQESAEMGNPPDVPLLHALYDEARRTGMHVMTLAQAAQAARTFAAAPRAVAFPVIAPFAPPNWVATIDFHDARAAMTFAAGQSLPTRYVGYDVAVASPFAVSLPETPLDALPVLTAAVADHGTLALQFFAPQATHFGIAFWSDPRRMGWVSPDVYPAGNAGAVAVFDLAAGVSQRTLRCAACTSTRLPYAT